MATSSVVDLRSDTVTIPTDAMRRAMAAAEVGDDVLDGDPTTHRLEERVAALLGHEAALFFPTGTQANQVAVGLHAPAGSEGIVESDAHIVRDELAGVAAIWGVQLRQAPTGDGRLSVEHVEPLVRDPSPSEPCTSFVAVENTHSAAGGRVTDVRAMSALRDLSRRRGFALHIDGARLWHAAVALQVEPRQIAELGDTVMVSFSKGLGCPVGSCLAGSAALMAKGVVLRRRLGGGMRQSGVVAAAALHALDHHLHRLEEDHRHARRLADALGGHPAYAVVPPDTNMVMLDLHAWEATAARDALRKAGVLLSVFGPRRLRAVPHLGIAAEHVDWAAGIIRDVLSRGTA